MYRITNLRTNFMVSITSNPVKVKWMRVALAAIVFYIIVFIFILFPKSSTSFFRSPLLSLDGNSTTNNYLLDTEVTIIDRPPKDILSFNQRDSRLVNYLKVHHLTPPSNLPYNFNGKFSKGPDSDSAITNAIGIIFKNAPSGFFVECGAYDGIYSNTLFLEREFGWSGLLIECNPVMIPQLRKTHRKAFVSDVCVSVTEKPGLVNMSSMDTWPASSSIGKGDIFPKKIQSTFTQFEIWAAPLYSLIAATGVTVVDFISLDVQSIEWEIIKKFPFEAIFVKVWVIEVVLLSTEDQQSMKALMRRNGYRRPIELGTYHDYLFVHESLPLDPSIKSNYWFLPPKRSYRGRSANSAPSPSVKKLNVVENILRTLLVFVILNFTE